MCFTPCAACIFQGDDDQSDRAEKGLLFVQFCCACGVVFLHGFIIHACCRSALALLKIGLGLRVVYSL